MNIKEETIYIRLNSNKKERRKNEICKQVDKSRNRRILQK